MKFLGYILHLIIKPSGGWERVGERNYPSAEWLRTGFFPLLALLAISGFAKVFYGGNFTLSNALQYSIMEVVEYFAGLFISREVLTWIATNKIADKEAEAELTEKISVFSILCMGILVLIETVKNFAPIESTIFALLPFCVIIPISYSAYYFQNENTDRPLFYIIAWISFLSTTMVIYAVFDFMLSPHF